MAKDMASMTDLTNSAVDMPLGGKIVKVKRLSVGEIWSIAESGVRNQRINDAVEMSKKMTSVEKYDFMRLIMKEMPTGETLQEASGSFLGSYTGIIEIVKAAIIKATPKAVSYEIQAIIGNCAPQELTDFVGWCIGSDTKDETDPKGQPEDTGTKS